MYSNEHSLQDLLKTAYNRLEMSDVVDEMDVKTAYERVVGDLIARLTWKVRYQDGKLSVTLASAALRQELFYRRESLRVSINDAVGRNVVQQIEFY